jgi:hypothetical protein
MVGLLEPIVQEMDARSSKIMDSQKILMEKVESFSDGGLMGAKNPQILHQQAPDPSPTRAERCTRRR